MFKDKWLSRNKKGNVMRNLLMLFLFSFLVSIGFTSCSTEKKNEIKKTFIVKVSEKVQEASVHSLECKTGAPVYAMVEGKLLELAKMKSVGIVGSGVVKNLCKYGVSTVFPYVVDMGSGKLPQSWIDDGCSLDSVGEDIEKLADKLCEKIE